MERMAARRLAMPPTEETCLPCGMSMAPERPRRFK